MVDVNLSLIFLLSRKEPCNIRFLFDDSKVLLIPTTGLKTQPDQGDRLLSVGLSVAIGSNGDIVGI